MEFLLVRDGDGDYVIINQETEFIFDKEGFVTPKNDAPISTYDNFHYIDRGSPIEKLLATVSKGLRKRSKTGRRIKMTVKTL